jgi:TatD DNase family protein
VLADTHCHLYFDVFKDDLADVLERAWQNGLTRILIPGIDLETSRQAVELSESHPYLLAAVGVHPNDALSWDDGTLKQLTDLAHHPKVVAIGEIGLDYYRDRAARDLQVQVFQSQLELARGLNLPVIIHNRQAEGDLWPILKVWQENLEIQNSPLAKRPGVFHSYNGDSHLAESAVQHNFLLGISGPVTFKNAPALQDLVTHLPLESLLLETDAPFLTPHPYRGRRNEPAHIAEIAAKIAALQQQPEDIIAEQTSQNADRLFQWRALD